MRIEECLEKNKDVFEEVIHYWRSKETINEIDNLIVLENNVVIPKSSTLKY